MNKESLRALQHSLNQDLPIRSFEIRELFLRHVISDPYNEDKREMSIALGEFMLKVLGMDGDKTAVPHEEWSIEIENGYQDGFRDACPMFIGREVSMDKKVDCLSRTMKIPRSIAFEIGWLLGYKAGSSLVKVDNSFSS